MLHDPISDHKTLGADLRALRKSRGLTLEELADRLGRSTGWLSQVERAISQPTDNDLAKFSAALSAPLSMLIAKGTGAGESGRIVRADARRRLDRDVPGLKEELLSPDLTDDFEVVYSTFAPGAKRKGPVKRPTQELGVVIAGALDLEIDGQAFTVRKGDSFRLRQEPYAWANPYDEPAVLIWVISPPVY